MSDDQEELNFKSDRHALYTGWVMALAMMHGLEPEPEMDGDGNYTDRFSVLLRDRVGMQRVTFVVPPPPDEWVAPGE